jgi:serine/threonine protein kinase
MNNKTHINKTVQEGNATVINNSVNVQGVTVVNSTIASDSHLPNGTLFCGKYEVQGKMDVATGEADLYICSYENRQFVAKVYRRAIAIKDEVVQALKSIDSPYVSKIYDYDTYNDLPLEILPYYKNSSLQGKKFSFEQLKKHIIPSLNEGLQALHACGVIHKDLKPSNIMLADNEKDVAIIDFGISSVKNDGNTVVVTKTGMTPEYSAPETFRNLYLEESDYYSLGVTVFELFCGYTPYKNMNAEAIEQFVSVQRLPFPEAMPKELKDFISAVTYYDITNRKNKKNSNRRWTYEEVKEWCQGKKLIVPGEGVGNPANAGMLPYAFLNKQYTDVISLGAALAQNWEEGKKQLFRGLLSAHFRNFNADILAHCLDAELDATKSTGKDNVIFMKLLYKIIPDLKAFCWKGIRFESLPALGRDMLDRLWKNDTSRYKYYDSILSEKVLSLYIQLAAPDNKNFKSAVEGIEAMYGFENSDNRSKMMTYYLMAYMLSGQKILDIDGAQYRDMGELADYMKKLLNESYKKFQAFCHRLIDDNDILDVQFESWIIAIGKRKELDRWKETLAL